MSVEFISNLLRYSAPVGIAAMGETLGQRAGVINIGLEGMMISSAYAGMVASQTSHSPLVGVLAGALTGLVLAAVQSFFTLKLAADQIVCGTAINLLGLGLTGTLYRMNYGNSGQLLSVPKIPQLAGGLDFILICWILLTLAMMFVLFRTKIGLAVRACGEKPEVVTSIGFSVIKLRFLSLCIGGVLAGVAGAYLSLGIAGSFAENMTAGRGFVALAMVTFGRWNTIGVFCASLFIGYADSLQFELQAKGVNLPPQLFIALPYVLALAVLIVVGRGTAVPESLGKQERT